MDIQRFNFGPPLIGLKVDDELVNELFEKANTLTNKANKNLAGKIENEFFYTDEMIFKFSYKILKYINVYIDVITGEDYKIKHDLYLKNLWVNFQKAHEYNPIHSHNDHISFVIYLKISEEIKNEPNDTTGPSNGSINFYHGTNTNYKSIIRNDILDRYLQPHNKISLIPEVGDMYIFPAYLEHHVESFHTKDAERISVSGNIIIR